MSALHREEFRSILIVEDEADIRESMRQVFAFENYTTFVAQNGRVALELLKTIPNPSLIFLDLMMPEMNGWEFAETLKRDTTLAEIPIIVATAFPEQIGKIQAAGVIKKPFKLDVLLDFAAKFSRK